MRFKGSNVIAVMALGASLFGGMAIEGKDGAKRPAVSKVDVVKPTAVDPYMSRLVNCEDMDVQPCFTNDEGKWRIVYSYEPYKARTVVLCKQEDGSGSTLPCLWKDDNAGKTGFQTRNYFWSKTF